MLTVVFLFQIVDIYHVYNDRQQYQEYTEDHHDRLSIDNAVEQHLAYACDGLVDVICTHEEAVEIADMLQIH